MEPRHKGTGLPRGWWPGDQLSRCHGSRCRRHPRSRPLGGRMPALSSSGVMFSEQRSDTQETWLIKLPVVHRGGAVPNEMSLRINRKNKKLEEYLSCILTLTLRLNHILSVKPWGPRWLTFRWSSFCEMKLHGDLRLQCQLQILLNSRL